MQFIPPDHRSRKVHFYAVLAMFFGTRYISSNMTTGIFDSEEASITGPWRNSYSNDGARWLASLSTPWWISGGWALDLFAGAQSRAHKDLDIGVLRRDAVAAAGALAGWEVFEAKNGVLAHLVPGSTVAI